jgi:hypothetical protein
VLDGRLLERRAQLKVNTPPVQTLFCEMKRSREPEEDSDAPSPVSDDHRESNPQEDETAPRAKIVGLDPSSAVSEDRSSVEMRCSLPGHREVLVFKTYDEFDSHYNKDHSHRCLECRKNFPSGHLLNLHHEESHDPLLAVKREQGEHTVSHVHLTLSVLRTGNTNYGYSTRVLWRDAIGSAGRHRNGECI